MRYKPTSIKKEGLKAYLNRTSDKHNDLNYATYTTMKELGVSKAERARRFGVSWDTMNRWYKLEPIRRPD